MKRIFNAKRLDLTAFAWVLQEPVAMGRHLLMLATISLLTMPLTQHIWTWDHVLRGGQDFETWMLTILIILCLAVLLSQLCKRHIELLFTLRRGLAFTLNPGELPERSPEGAFFIFGRERVNGAAIDRYSHPLKI